MGEPKVKGWWLIRLALTIIGKKGLKEFEKISKDGKKAQEEFLRHILSTAKDTVYGKEHHFADILKAESADELFDLYAKNVPLIQYEDIRPYVERHKNGESDVLYPGKPKLYATTSGTTKEPKWIPIFEEYYQEICKKMNQYWFYTLIREKPHVWDKPALSIVGKAVEGAAPDGTLYGSISGISQRDIPKFMQVIHTAPADVFHIVDYKARYYAIMRMGIERDAHLIIAANPSSLVEMQNNANEFYDEYVDDIEKGTLSHKFPIAGEIRAVLEAKLKPNPKRAQELRDLKAKYGTVLPKHYWPNMQVVNVWFCGNTQIYFEKIKDSFAKDCVFHEFGFYATECKPGIVMKSGIKDTTLFPHKTYFEFIHESELDKENPRIWKMHEVKKGERYSLIVSTCSGLYRYFMNDLVEISGFHNTAPTLFMVQKLNGIISLTGEKLHESQFIDAVHDAEKKTGRKLAFFVGFADVDKSNYRFYYEFSDTNTTQKEAEDFTARLDEILKEYNQEYREKRNSNRIKAPDTSLLVKDSFEKFKSTCIEKGSKDGQFKLNLLMQDEKRQAMFNELVK
ncbi:MAG: GH3 auxin-responsive promoter family protein [Spirochaetaceae bacterium]|jgi:hypothetical protein|nr:GH3 auxin-responsive promoter family protein [Spirochaetaceae bacterium]